MKLKALLIFAVFFPILIGPMNSYAENIAAKPSRCAALLSSASSFYQTTKSYGREVVETRGRSLFLKSFEEVSDEKKWAGILSKQQPQFHTKGVSRYLRGIINYLPRKVGGLLAGDSEYQFTPFEGLYNITMKQPVGYLSRKLSGTKFEPAFFFKIPVVLALSIGVYLGADAHYKAELQNHIDAEITTHSADYDELIQSDFRFNKIRLALQKGEISQEEAHEEAYFITLAYSQYFQYRDSQPNEPHLESEMGLIDHYLFSHLKPVIENGVTPAQGYYVPEKSVGPLSEAQILNLFQNAHLRYLKYQIAVEMIGQSDLFMKMKLDPQFSEIVKRVEDDPFSKALVELHQNGQITTQQLQLYLQEDIYWQNRFQDWATIGVTRLKVVNGENSDQPLTIEDIRGEILAEVLSE